MGASNHNTPNVYLLVWMGRKVIAMKVHRVGFNAASATWLFRRDIVDYEYTVKKRISTIIGSI